MRIADRKWRCELIDGAVGDHRRQPWAAVHHENHEPAIGPAV
ncbi:MAG: hypothetical protein ACRDY7_03190 [Acidimicrobiia bacterium]